MTDVHGILGESSPRPTFTLLVDSRPLAMLSLEDQCNQVLSKLHQSWRTFTGDDVRENLVFLALIISSTTDSSIKNVVQKGLLRTLQKHYVSYRKGKDERYAEFQKKFELLMDSISQSFHSSSSKTDKSSTVDTDDEEVQVLCHLLQSSMDRHSGLLLYVLKCLERVSLSCEAKATVLQATLPRLARVEVSELPMILTILGDLPTDDIESFQTISSIRKLWRQVEEIENSETLLLQFASKVVMWFAKEWNGHFLATAYLQSIDDSTEQSSFENGSVSVLDFIVLLSLSLDADFGDQAKQILRSWVDLADYFGALHRALGLLKTIENSQQEIVWEVCDFCQEMASPIMDLAIHHLKSTDQEHSKRVHEFCTRLFDEFLRESDRPHFVNAVVRLCYESFEAKQENGVLYKVLRRLTKSGSAYMRPHRDLFVGMLQSSTTLNPNVAHDICAVTVEMFGAQEQEELLCFVDRLLFMPVLSRGDGRMVHGFALATEIVRQGLCDASAMDDLRKSVLRILLPSDRRMVSPELGSPGLVFLECYAGKSTGVFRDIQMVLANTGLIQRLSAYRQSKRKYIPTLGYTQQNMKSPTKDSDFIFCVAFFLRHVDYNNFDQWDATIYWVFNLVDSYLACGRKRSKTLWNPRGWLQAVVEFPRLKFPLDVKGDQQKRAVKWILTDLGTFDIGKPGCTPAPSNFRSICTDLFVRNPAGVPLFYTAILRFSIGLLVGTCVSAASLRNAFAYYKDLPDHSKKPPLLQMIKGQVAKLYHLKDKIKAVECTLVPLEASMKRLNSDSNSKRKVNQLLSTEKQKAVSSGIMQLRETLTALCDRVFSTSVFIDDEILWECITDAGDDEMFKNHLNYLLSISSRSKRTSNTHEMEAMLSSKLRIASQLVSSGRSYFSSALQNYLLRLTSFTFFLVPLLPRLRGALSEMDSPPLSLWVRYSAVAIQLLTLYFIRAGDHGDDALFHLKSLASVIVQDERGKKHSMHDVVGRVRKILSTVDDAHIANGLMEFLSILGNLFNGLRESVAQTSAESLGKSLANCGAMTTGSGLPVSLNIASKTIKAPANSLPIIRKALDVTLCRRSSSRDGAFDAFWVHRYALLRHFGLLVMQSRSSEYELDSFLEKIVNEVESTLETMGKKSRHSSRNRSKASSEKSPKRRTSSFPILAASNVADFFEVCLHMSLGGTVMFPPASSRGGDDTSFSPYTRFEAFLNCFHRLMGVYFNHFSLFPRKSVVAVHITAKQVLDIASVQIKRCADWRSSYRLPRSGSLRDPGSLVYFKTLIASCRSLLVDDLAKIAKVWIEDKASQAVSKGRSLEQWISRFKQTLDDISSSNGLSCDETQRGNVGVDWSENKRRRVGSPSDQLKCSETEIDKLNVDTTNGAEVHDEDESFGAAGDWGGGSCMDDDSISSAEAITIHKTM